MHRQKVNGDDRFITAEAETDKEIAVIETNETIKLSGKAEDYASMDAYFKQYNETTITSFEQFRKQGLSWCWCLVGNIGQEHEFGEEHEIRYGTKQFSRGTKVYLAPSQWGDGYERIVVIGLPRYGNQYIEVITHSGFIENYRMQKVYKPAVLEMMCSSPYRWWGASEYWREKIIEYLETRNPEEAARQKALSERDSDDRK